MKKVRNLGMLFFISLVCQPALSQWTTSGTNIYNSNTGFVGIGTTSPNGRLAVAASTAGDGIWLGGTGNTSVAFLNNMTLGAWNGLTQPGDDLFLWKGSAPDNVNSGGLVIGPWSSGNSGIRVTSAGYVGIGTAFPQSLLAVKGTITTQKVVVTQTGWADYVFEGSYPLLPLPRLERYVRENKHLPEIPSADEVARKGIDLGDNQAALLKKIEELTLYIIAQDKTLLEYDKKFREEDLKNQVLQKRIEKLEKLVEQDHQK